MSAPALRSVPLRARDDGLGLRVCWSQCDSFPAEVQGKLSEVVHNAPGDLTKVRLPGLTLTLLPTSAVGSSQWKVGTHGLPQLCGLQ